MRSLRQFHALAALLICLGLLPALPAFAIESMKANPLARRDVPVYYKALPMLFVAHENGGDAFAQEPLPAYFSEEPFTTLIGETHWAMVEGGAYFHLPSFDIRALEKLVPLPSLNADKNGFLLIQFVTPECAECEQLTDALKSWSERFPAVQKRWIQVDLAPSRLRGCWKGYRFDIAERSKHPTSSGNPACLK